MPFKIKMPSDPGDATEFYDYVKNKGGDDIHWAIGPGPRAQSIAEWRVLGTDSIKAIDIEERDWRVVAGKGKPIQVEIEG